jgi:hypothetical protein
MGGLLGEQLQGCVQCTLVRVCIPVSAGRKLASLQHSARQWDGDPFVIAMGIGKRACTARTDHIGSTIEKRPFPREGHDHGPQLFGVVKG